MSRASPHCSQVPSPELPCLFPLPQLTSQTKLVPCLSMLTSHSPGKRKQGSRAPSPPGKPPCSTQVCAAPGDWDTKLQRKKTPQLLKFSPCFGTLTNQDPASASHNCRSKTSLKKPENQGNSTVSGHRPWPTKYTMTSVQHRRQPPLSNHTSFHSLGWWDLMSFSTRRSFKAGLPRKTEKLNVVEISSYMNYCSPLQIKQLQLSLAEAREEVFSDRQNKLFHLFFSAPSTLDSFLFHPNSSNTLKFV